jgi:putative membrane protein
MQNRVLTLAMAGILLLGLSAAVAQDTSQSSSSAQTETGTKAKGSKKSSGSMSATQQGTASDKSASGTVPAADKAFMTKAAEGGLAEVQLGQLAADKASSNDVKDFGKQMSDDHGKANDQLKSIAAQKGVTLPSDLNAKDKAEKDRLSKLSGEQFDKAYMQAMVKDHMKDVSEFKRESTTAKDTDVKNFASQTLPTLESHLEKAKTVAGSVGATGKASAAKSKTKASKTSASTSPPQ